jgi:hypothetical protein
MSSRKRRERENSPVEQEEKPPPLEKKRRHRSDSIPYEVEQWNEAGERLIRLLSKSVEAPAIKIDTPSKKRFALEAMCAELCRRSTEENELDEKYESVKRKYEKSKSKLRRLGDECDLLTTKIEENRLMLDDHMKELRKQEQTEIDERMNQLEELLSAPWEDQEHLLEVGSRQGVISLSARVRSVSKTVPERPPPKHVEINIKSREKEQTITSRRGKAKGKVSTKSPPPRSTITATTTRTATTARTSSLRKRT